MYIRVSETGCFFWSQGCHASLIVLKRNFLNNSVIYVHQNISETSILIINHGTINASCYNILTSYESKHIDFPMHRTPLIGVSISLEDIAAGVDQQGQGYLADFLLSYRLLYMLDMEEMLFERMLRLRLQYTFEAVKSCLTSSKALERATLP